jgi:hypothetical protein
MSALARDQPKDSSSEPQSQNKPDFRVIDLVVPLPDQTTTLESPEEKLANRQVNFHTAAGLIAIGQRPGYYCTHADVFAGLKLYHPDISLGDLEYVSGLKCGNNYHVRIENCTAVTDQILTKYRIALQMAHFLALRDGGKVTIACDYADETPWNNAAKTPKILGIYHLQEKINNQGFIRKSIKHPPFGQVIYNFATGTRYIFPQTVQTLAAKLPNLTKEQALEIIGNLIFLITSKNKSGVPEARFFLLDPKTNTIRKNADIHGNFAEKFQRVRTSIESSPDWRAAANNAATELHAIAEELKEQTTQDFFEINLSSQLFVDLVSSTLRGTRDIDQANTTQRIPVEGGYFVGGSADGERRFVVTTQDPLSRRVISWAFSANNATLSTLNADINKATYLVLYKLESTAHHEHHPAPFSKQFGHLEPTNGIVLEIGFEDRPTIELVIDEDVWSEKSWTARLQQVSSSGSLAQLRAQIDNARLTELLRHYKREQYRIIREIIGATDNPNLFVANDYRYFSLPNRVNAIGGDNTISLPAPQTSGSLQEGGEGNSSTPYRARNWVNGQLAHTLNFDTWNRLDLKQALKHLADMMVVGIIAQLPHIPLHDINIVRMNPNQSDSKITMTLLSASESFCGIGGIDHDKYIDGLVPIICGNLIARFLANSVASGKQEELDEIIDECVSQMASTFGRLVDAKQSQRTRILTALQQASRNDCDEPPPQQQQLNIGAHLDLSRRILNLSDQQIGGLVNKVKEAAQRELALIRTIAPVTDLAQGTPAPGADRTDAVNAVCACIWRHTQEQGVDKDVNARDAILKKLEVFAKLTGALSIAQRTWLITLIDFELRDHELGLNSCSQITEIHSKAANERDFSKNIREQLPKLDLSDTDLTNLYNSINGLKDVINSHDTPGQFLAVMSNFLSPATLSIISPSEGN